MKIPEILKILQVSQKNLRDPKVRLRLQLFHRAISLGNIARACREFQTSPQLYHYWWRRYSTAGFDREALRERSRRPKNSPRRLSAKVTRQICRYRQKFQHSAEKIRSLLEQEQGLPISLPTIYRVLSREGLGRQKKKSVPLRRALSSATEIPPQKIAEQYRVRRVLGSGGGGVVYWVDDLKKNDKKVALKLLELRKDTEPALIDRLKHEFITLASLRHPHLARVFDFGRTEREIYFTSEYIPGRDFLTATHGVHLNLIFQWIVQILSALDFLHHRGILHLDIKPTNILVTDPDASGEVSAKLIDFGSSDCRKAGQAVSGEVMGTPPYVAPELLLERPPSFASDLYSFGILLHQVFFGVFPFRETDPIARMKEQIYQDPLRLTSLPPALPEEFADILHKMVARDPQQRFHSAREVLEEINQCLGENFNLRSDRAPVRILEASEYFFHEAQAQELLQIVSTHRPQLAVISAQAGMGKSRVLRWVKESLQLGGVFPLLFTEPSEWERYFKSGEKSSAPLLLDNVLSEELPQVLERLDDFGVHAIVATREAPSLEVFAHRWIELPPLSPQEVLKFFQTELVGFPNLDTSHPLLKLSDGNPKKLEEVLQALQELGVLQWTEQGWQWNKGLDPDYSQLLSKYAALWEERARRVEEILRLSPLGLSASTLAGVLGVETGNLEEKLIDWQKDGRFKSKIVKNLLHYYLPRSRRESHALARLSDERWQEELESLYRQGDFESGRRFADLLRAQAPSKKLTPQIALACARHYAAAGSAAEALATVPVPSSHPNPGLCYETQGRGHFKMGQLPEALHALEQAHSEYSQKQDRIGLSRVANLRGSIFKRMTEFSQSRSYFEEAIRQAAAGVDPYNQGMAQMNLAILFQEQGEYEQAYSTYEAAMNLEKKAEHPLLSSLLRLNWLNLVFFLGRGSEAEQTCYELLRLSLKHHYVEFQASALNFLALIAGQKNHHDLQLNFLNQALSLLKAQQLWFPYTQTLLNRASFLWEQKRYTPAELDAQFALALAKRQKNPLFTAWAQLYLGRILRDRPRPDWSMAEEYLARSRQGIWRAKNQPLYWEVEFDRGLLAKKKGEVAQAREFFLSAHAQLEDFLNKVPDFVQQSYLRDRKMEKVTSELAWVESQVIV